MGMGVGGGQLYMTWGHSCEVDNGLLSSWLQEVRAELTGMFTLVLFYLDLMLYGNEPIDY